jgi:hypothetical protein
VARTGLKPVSSVRVGYAFRSPLFERMGDERTLPLSVPNGFHEKVSLVKVNVVSEAQTKARRVRLLPRFHSHSV